MQQKDDVMNIVKRILSIGLVAIAMLVIVPGAYAFQSGTFTLSGWPTTGRIVIDNGGPTITVLPEAAGTVTLNGATPITVAAPSVDAGSIIEFTLKTIGGSVGGGADIQTITPGTGFTVNGTAGDLSTYNFVILG